MSAAPANTTSAWVSVVAIRSKACLSAGGARGNQQNVVSYGEERPTCRVSNEDCWWQNRRVEIVYTAR